MKTLFAITLVGITLTLPQIGGATGRLKCDSGDQNTWKSQKELKETVIAQGWKVRRVKVDGGCYELYGTTPEGQRVEAYFDPLTLEKLLVARRGKVIFKKQ